LPGGGGLGIITGIIGAIIGLVIGIVVLISVGAVKSKGKKQSGSAVLVLVLGILGLLFASWIGGVLVIIAAILMFLGM
jgi:hypothetical protein